MKRRDPRLLLGVLTLVAVVAVVAYESRRTSPGPLAPVHARETELAAADGCHRCHGASGESMAEACACCHAEIAAQLRERKGFHGAHDAAECGRCHAEHHGEAVELAGERAFTLAGIASRAAFEHDFVLFSLGGVHDELACERCHARAGAPLLAKGEKRFLGLDQRCTSCHEDPHRERFGADCAQCHGQEHPFAEHANFVHIADFPLEGAHAALACERCHAEDSVHSVARVAGNGTKPPRRQCAACHESPHGAPFLARVAELLAAQPGDSCARCHSALHASFAVEPPAMERELHTATGFSLATPHDRLACSACHGEHGGASRFAERYPGRRADDCAACHADPHGAQFELAGGQRPACIECHAAERFTPSKFDHAGHLAFPLEGAHARTACQSCHARARDGVRVFRGAPRRCEQCHADAHAGAFDAFVERRAAASAGTCAHCHGTERFDDAAASFGVAEHGPATGFALAGAHARLECESCHARSAQPDGAGRRFGRVSALFGERVDECSACHADVHGGAFERTGLAATVAGRTGCARCHGEEGFRELRQPFDHGAWTGFVLDGAHASMACSACHGSAERASTGRTFGLVSARFPGPPVLCATCHRDPHAGAFDREGMPRRVGGAEGCARCHTTRSFRELARESFDHAAFAAFPLEGQHAAAACEACHVPPRDPPAGGRRLGPAAGTECAGCHADPHAGQLARDGVTACERCHAPSSFAEVRFDHARDSRFALDERHARLDCAACHRPSPLADGRVITRYKPLGTTCADCHGFRGRGER